MFEAPETDSLDADAILDRAEAAQRDIDAGEVNKLKAAADWARLHDTVAEPEHVLDGTERLVTFGGDGTPLAAEFCPLELGCVLGLSRASATVLVADALDLQHRLPRTWAKVSSGQAKAWVGRKVAQATRNETPATAAHVDARVSTWVHKLSWGRLEKIVAAAIAEADPAAAQAAADAKAAETGVWLRPSNDHGVKDITIRALASDAIWFDSSVDRVADALAALGADEAKDVLRGRAVGVLARPQHALDLIAQAQVLATGQPAPEPAAPTVDTRPKAVLHVHLTDQAIRSGQGVARVEGEGPVTIKQAREWLGHCAVTVRPVVDLNRMAPADAYEVPDRLKQATHLISPTDCFPYATNQTRNVDIDHTTAFDRHGPPGQTAIGNLGPLTRFHHRAKTHAGWQVQQPWPGVYVWKSPHGRHYLVDHTGTTPLKQPA